MNSKIKLATAVIVSQLAGIIGSIFTTTEVNGWYSTITKPSFNPPSWVFGPVWTTLFLLMGIAAYLVWKRGFEDRTVRLALGVFILQLVLNTFWSIIFFNFQSPGWAFVEICFLWITIIATIILFTRVSKVAAWLLVSYILWVSFAGFLNYTLYTLN